MCDFVVEDAGGREDEGREEEELDFAFEPSPGGREVFALSGSYGSFDWGAGKRPTACLCSAIGPSDPSAALCYHRLKAQQSESTPVRAGILINNNVCQTRRRPHRGLKVCIVPPAARSPVRAHADHPAYTEVSASRLPPSCSRNSTPSSSPSPAHARQSFRLS